MAIKKIKIHNFKSLREFETELNPGLNIFDSPSKEMVTTRCIVPERAWFRNGPRRRWEY